MLVGEGALAAGLTVPLCDGPGLDRAGGLPAWTLARWVLTVPVMMDRAVAISALVMPSASSMTTSSSRGDSRVAGAGREEEVRSCSRSRTVIDGRTKEYDVNFQTQIPTAAVLGPALAVFAPLALARRRGGTPG
ncbi:hypothetical protein GCM10010145_47510 [Streptomyces ruber]|uniref:Uncharacterized protein n=3 Tax=Streptomyces TaxID=1883 RepID=A0A918BIX1_9ACTN|nr:hypothetical protein GCM10010145_47510 [Streptomyces ruber]